MRYEKLLLTCLLLSSVAACAANNKSEPRPEPPAPSTKPMALFDLPGVDSPEVLVYFTRVQNERKTKTWLCPEGTAFRGMVSSSVGLVEVTLPTGVPVDASPETGNKATMTWVAVDMSGVELQPDSTVEPFSFAVFFSPLKGDIMRSTFNTLTQRYDIGPIDLRKTKTIPDNVSYKYTVATTNPNGRLKNKCEPLDPLIRVLR